MIDLDGLYILLGAFLLIGLGLLALYLLRSLGVYRLAQNAGIPNPGLAWVPIARDYLLGCLCDRAAYCRAGKKWNFALWLPIVSTLGSPFLYAAITELFSGELSLQVANYLLASGLQGMLTIAAAGLTAVALYYLYCDYAPGQEGLYTVLSVVFSFAAPHILLFCIRNRRPCSVTGAPPARRGPEIYTTSPPPRRPNGPAPPAPPPGANPPPAGGVDQGAPGGSDQPPAPPQGGNPPPAGTFYQGAPGGYYQPPAPPQGGNPPPARTRYREKPGRYDDSPAPPQGGSYYYRGGPGGYRPPAAPEYRDPPPDGPDR